MYLGEIAVSHPQDAISATTIWTKSGDETVMVPFISCAQTIAIIDGKIQSSNKSYDVKAKAGEAHLEVVPSVDGSATTFTLNTKDVQSKEEFEAYSSSTHNTLTGITDVLYDLLNDAITEISGDTIIVAEEVENGTGSNRYNLTHRTGEQTSGFKKLTTDAYGHVTASTDVEASDINAIVNVAGLSAATESISGYAFSEIHELSAGTIQLSADTEAAISKAINDLDSAVSASTAGKYLTAVSIKDGLLDKIEEADIPELEVESAGTGNVVSKIEVNDHKITYTTTSVATSTDIQNLSAVTLTGVTFNGTPATVTDHVAALTETQLSTATTGNGNVVTNITVSGHEITFEKNIDALQNVTATGDSYVDASVATNSAITVGLAETPAQSANDIATASTTGALADAYAVKLYVEDVLSSSVDYKGATASTPTAATKGDLYIASGDFVVEGNESAETGDFIIYDGEHWQVIEKNLNGAITGNLTQDTVTLGDSTNSVKSLPNGNAGQALLIGTAGTPEWSDISDSATTQEGHYTPTTTASTLGTTSNQNLAWGETVNVPYATVDSKGHIVATGNSTVTMPANPNTDESVTAVGNHYTADTATQTGGTEVTSSAQAIKGITYDAAGHIVNVVTGSVLTGETQLSKGATVTGETAGAAVTDIAVDNHQITLTTTNKVFSASTADAAVSAGTAGKVVSALTINILDSAGTTASTTTYDGSNAPVVNIPGSHDTATTETGHYTPSTVANTSAATAGSFISGISLDSKNHVMAVGYADKVNSASTTESADTADKVAHTLSVSGYANSDSSTTTTTGVFAYDGSTNETLTFGKHSSVGNSMSVSNGVVDVEIIDCGEY